MPGIMPGIFNTLFYLIIQTFQKYFLSVPMKKLKLKGVVNPKTRI